MIVLAYIIFAFAAIQFLVAMVNLVFPQSFPETENSYNPLVSVLIPARNEEKNIANILTDLCQLPYNNLEIIVFNDQSEDKTGEIVREFVKKDSRIKIIDSAFLPDGWLGKNHACHTLAKNASGRFFLFLDADVRISGEILSKTILFSDKNRLGLISVFPRQTMKTLGEWITVPNMNYILLTLLPLILVLKTSFSSLAAANGQFMFFRADIYNQFQPHEKMKASKVEDILIARLFKKNSIKIACISAKDSIECRMYSSFGEALNGFSKNVIMFFGNSFIAAMLFWLVTSFGFIAALIGLPELVFYMYLLLLVLTRIAVSVKSGQNTLKNILLIVPQQITLGLFIFKAIENKFRKKLEWKGRSIS